MVESVVLASERQMVTLWLIWPSVNGLAVLLTSTEVPVAIDVDATVAAVIEELVALRT